MAPETLSRKEVIHKEAKIHGYNNLAITGTKYLMTGPVYPGVLMKSGIMSQIPDQQDREKIDTIIFKELVNGVFNEVSRLYFNRVINQSETKWV